MSHEPRHKKLIYSLILWQPRLKGQDMAKKEPQKIDLQIVGRVQFLNYTRQYIIQKAATKELKT